ncbi:glycosyltransferase [Pseudorhodobacter sp. MZDSW-24AT]|uniref:glycosyltransferase n=1 Tax=Pseudorhodobacter sp. MZDSW-24AT TaxID=2052957 RepID=UPI000C1EDCD1|nr:glycosyltransferase [Pseudorhodobacter sp. MZDSW-24AT]PJF08612.1 glycosyl transferase [Pseudorhodobacter sp. MZDSW-24AT]
MLSVIIPASNEAGYIGDCLRHLCASDAAAVQVIVVANGCRDATADVARAALAAHLPQGWRAQVLELAQGSKPGALNAGDAAAVHPARVYLDADVTVSPGLLAALGAVLDTDAPRYASGTPVIPPAQSAVTRAYARFWQGLPFNQTSATGYGLFAVNAAGRARWGAFPAIIADDTFARLQFLPPERVQVADTYHWPMIEGFSALVRVRRRQDAGGRQLNSLYPELMPREGKPALTLRGLLRLACRHPIGFATYAAVSVAVRARRGGSEFTRGR